VDSVGSWYWGHGRLGPYYVVWYDAVTPAGAEFVSAYVSRDGRVVGAQCSGIQVRPVGANSTYPPTMTAGNPANFYITIDVGGSKRLEFNVSRECTTVEIQPYRRWTGKLQGGFQESETWEGVALYEEFALFP
jgi:hypothetical protein